MDAMQWIVSQVTNVAYAEKQPEKFNPRPQGVIVNGSGSDVVLEFLRRDFKYRTRAEIVAALKERINEHRIEWGLIYLRRNGLIKWIEDASRNSRYGRYVALREGECRK